MNKLNKKNIFYILIMTIIIVVIYYAFFKREDYLEIDSNFNIGISNEENTAILDNSVNEGEEKVSNKIVIHITGAVQKEGVYELEENSRIADCIQKAGGLTEEANTNNINLAYIVQDGMKLHIPKKSENNNEIKDNTDMYISSENSNIDNAKEEIKSSKTTKININTASQTELETLPGIGESTAVKIINYRNENGKFSNIEDIKKVNGIGESKYSKIKNLIKV